MVSGEPSQTVGGHGAADSVSTPSSPSPSSSRGSVIEHVSPTTPKTTEITFQPQPRSQLEPHAFEKPARMRPSRYDDAEEVPSLPPSGTLGANAPRPLPDADPSQRFARDTAANETPATPQELSGLASFDALSKALDETYTSTPSSVRHHSDPTMQRGYPTNRAPPPMSGWPPIVAGASFYGAANDVLAMSGGGIPSGNWLSSPVAGASGKNARRTGTTKFFNVLKGFGFILDDRANELGGDEVFVHYSAIEAVQSGRGGFRSLQEGEQVEYTIMRGPKGWQAQDVTGPDGAPCIGSSPHAAPKVSSSRDFPERPSASGIGSHRSSYARTEPPSGSYATPMPQYSNIHYGAAMNDPRFMAMGGYGATSPELGMMSHGPFAISPLGYQIVGLPQPLVSGSDTQVLMSPSSGGASGGGPEGSYASSPYPPQPIYYASYPAFDPNTGAMAYYPAASYGGVPPPAHSLGPTPMGVPRRGSGYAESAPGFGSPPHVPPGGYVYPIGPGSMFPPHPTNAGSNAVQSTSADTSTNLPSTAKEGS